MSLAISCWEASGLRVARGVRLGVGEAVMVGLGVGLGIGVCVSGTGVLGSAVGVVSVFAGDVLVLVGRLSVGSGRVGLLHPARKNRPTRISRRIPVNREFCAISIPSESGYQLQKQTR